jgi:hypothetical protein
MSVVKEEENHGFKDEPKFEMQDKFNIVLLCDYKDDS